MADEKHFQKNGGWVLERGHFNALFESLAKRGYRVVGPTVRDGAVVLGDISCDKDLPEGWTDEQGAGHYRLKQKQDGALFGYSLGPQSLKTYLIPPEEALCKAEKTPSGGFDVVPAGVDGCPPKTAFLGVRPCDLAALAIQDKVWLEGPFQDVRYKARREGLFIVAVNCTQAGASCFCASMRTGPKATSGFDLALTEVSDGARHFFLVEAGTEKGTEVLDELPVSPAAESQVQAADFMLRNTATGMRRAVDTTDLRDILYRQSGNPRWQETAKRCLSCANCTQVCPTCFCNTVEDVTSLGGESAGRGRRWDSCFSLDFSTIHGGSIRSSLASRYRQWLTHKFASWQDQFGVLGCVGCGRCITWCPAAIDVTEEIRMIRRGDRGGGSERHG